MKTAVLSTFCTLLIACSPDVTPVDMEYSVSVETLEDTCVDDPAPEGLTIPFNFALQTDGSMTVSYPTRYAPGRGEYFDFIVYDGETDLTSTRPSKTGPGDDVVRIFGSLTMVSTDLTIEERRWRQEEGTEPVPCVRKASLRGAARPFSTVSALDGKYEAYYYFYGQVCPPGQRPVIPIEWTVPLDIKERNGFAFFSFNSHDENLMFEMPTEALASGNVDWNGTMYLAVQPFDLYEFEGSVVGSFMDGKYSLNMKFHEVGDSTGCNFDLEAAGRKRAPDQTRISNVYRLAFSTSDACAPDTDGNPTTEVFEQEGDVVFRSNDQLTFMHGNERVNLDQQADGTYARHWMSGGETHDFTVSIVPPKLSFSHVYGQQTQNSACHTTLEAVGVPRYFVDLALDAPKLTDAKPRLAKSEPKPFGLAATLKNMARLRPLSEAPPIVREALYNRQLERSR